MNNRRDFLRKGLLGIAAMAVGSSLVKAEDFSSAKTGKIRVSPNDIILFQGDSITDAGRNRNNGNANEGNAFGNGYAMLAASTLLNKHAAKNLKIYNRGISGNRVPDLIGRWDQDAIALKPTILSIMIGVNDYWRTKDSGASNTPEQYKAQYKQLLDKTMKELPGVKLIICEPFAVNNVKHVNDSWFPDFTKYQQACREVAQEYNAVFLPFQQVFDKGLKANNGAYWTTDGVHTTMAGANLMAEAWLGLLK